MMTQQFLFRQPAWHPRPRRRPMLPSSITILAGLDFNSSTYEFGQRTGLAIAGFSIFALLGLTISVYADTDLALASQLFTYTDTTGSNGRLARKDHILLVAGNWYFVVFRNTADGTLNGIQRMQAVA